MFLPSNITLKFGDSGDFVSELQRRLATARCFNGDGVNGFYDGTTVNAVSQFQSMNGLRADGIAGPETLRRLNGVISGDTSSSSTTNNQAEEEQKAADAERQRMAAEALTPQQPPAPMIEPVRQEWQQTPEHQQAPQLAPVNYEQAPSYQPQQHHIPPQQPALAPSDILAQMLLAPQQLAPQPQHHQPVQQQQIHQPQPLQQQPPQPAVAAAPVHHVAPVQVAPQQPIAQHQLQPVAQTFQPAPQAQPQQQAVAAEPQRGPIGRAIQFAGEMMQKLSNYFESKLRPDVLAEVKEIGLTMAKSGVREVAIPMGPEQQRGVEGPARGQQQQQGQQR